MGRVHTPRRASHARIGGLLQVAALVTTGVPILREGTGFATLQSWQAGCRSKAPAALQRRARTSQGARSAGSLLGRRAAPDLPEVEVLQFDVPTPVLVLLTLIAAAVSAYFGLKRMKSGYLQDGELIFRSGLPDGGALRVAGVPVPKGELDVPGAPAGFPQEWRVMRFEPADQFIQAVARVWLDYDGQARGLGKVLSLPYNQSLVAVVLATLKLLGAPVEAAASRPLATGEAPRLRILCLGLGGGCIPAFFATTLPGCQVDVAELSREVLEASEEAMGLQDMPNLKINIEDGAGYALRAAEALERKEEGYYDAVVIDTYDSSGNVPEVMWRPAGGVAKALAGGLLRPKGAVAVNFLPNTYISERLKSYREALDAAGRAEGMGFTVEAPETNLMTVQTCGGPAFNLPVKEFQARLENAGKELKALLSIDFEMGEVASKGLQYWA